MQISEYLVNIYCKYLKFQTIDLFSSVSFSCRFNFRRADLNYLHFCLKSNNTQSIYIIVNK